ncbi:hypothetical protein K0U07_00470 [bacterium]|nr:hypothetical protein [bacterium]
MERELVYKNLAVIEEAVKQNAEILVDSSDSNLLVKVSSKEWESISDHRRKDRTKFVISKVIAYCPSVFEEDMEIRDEMFAISHKLVEYFTKRNMAPLAELMNELVMNERERDAFYHDYHRKQGS